MPSLSINGIDILIFIVLFAGVAFGFSQGVARLILFLLATYAATLAGGATYAPLARGLAKVFPTMQITIAEIIAFIMIVVLATVLFSLMGYRVVAYAAMPRSLAAVDQIGGALLGFGASLLGLFLSILIISLAIRILRYSFDFIPPSEGLAMILDAGIRTSGLVPVFLQLWAFVATPLHGFFGIDLPAILAPVT